MRTSITRLSFISSLKKSLFQFTAIAVLALFAMPHSSNAEVTIGKLAPNFTLPASDGTSHSLEQYRGKFVVLEWLNPECPYVRKHYESKNMQALQERYTGKGVVWFSISSSAEGKQGHLTPASAKEFMTQQGSHQTAILLDPSGSVGRSYNARTTPHMFVIDPQGKVIYAGAIDDNDSTRLSSVEDAKNYVAAALDEAIAGRTVSVATTQPYGCSVKYAA